MTKYSPAERERKILEMITAKGSLSIERLARMFSVSTMTIHRDLQRLEKMGHLQKRHGGAVLASVLPRDSLCSMCRKIVPGKQTFLIHLASAEQKIACCPHCGLMLIATLKESIWQALTMDFLHGHMISAGQAIYLVGSDLNVCCVPTILAFSSEQEALRFQKGFNGILATMAEASQVLLNPATKFADHRRKPGPA